MKTAATSKAPIAELDTHSWNVFDREFSPDGKLIVGFWDDGKTRVWKLT